MDDAVRLRIDPFPSNTELNELWRVAWGEHTSRDFAPILPRSLAHVGAYDGERLVGFVNVAWDGGIHAFILDTCVHPAFRRRGIGKLLVREARKIAGERGARWLHVDYDLSLEKFYAACGFQPTSAGLIRL